MTQQRDAELLILDAFRINRNKPRKCTCNKKRYNIDFNNKEVTCVCGIVVDPFDALIFYTTQIEKLKRIHNRVERERKQLEHDKELFRREKRMSDAKRD